MSDEQLLARAAELAREHLSSLPERHVGPTATLPELRASLGRPLTEGGVDAPQVLDDLVAGAQGGLVATPGPRYFGFVIGGALPVALAADWIVSAWDQNGGGWPASPAAAVIEEVAGGWLRELLGLPSGASVGFVTGGQMANFTALAAARHEVLRRAGWDVEAKGLEGAPKVRVLVGEEAHVTVFTALRLLGFGHERAERVPLDDRGRMRADALRETLEGGGAGPAIVCAQAGNVDSGAIDPLGEVATVAREHGAWCHVDGAFGLWAAASPRLAPLVAGHGLADSWATDAHKWLNVPYDCGVVAVADPAPHRAAMTMSAAYLPVEDSDQRWGFDWAPEMSRRARGIPVYAALRFLGRTGVAELVERCCELASRMAARLDSEPGLEVVNEVVLNQVLVRVGDDDRATEEVVRLVQQDGTCWLGGTTWQGRGAMRISVSNWSTREADADRSADSILEAARAVLAGAPAERGG